MEWSRLFDFNKPAIEVLYDILLKRGFLVELQGKELFLTDNALIEKRKNEVTHSMWSYKAKNDPDFLSELLENSNIGSLENERDLGHKTTPYRITIKDEHKICPGCLGYLFDFNQIGGESGYMVFEGYWRRFSKYKTGYKIPVSVLEPCIALLVKALSSVGVRTYSSCDGHGEREAHVSFIGIYDALWAEQLTDSISSILNFKYTRWEGGGITIHKQLNAKTYSVNYFSELFQMGIYLYKNRKFFRKLKMDFVKEISHDIKLLEKKKDWNEIKKRMKRAQGRINANRETTH